MAAPAGRSANFLIHGGPVAFDELRILAMSGGQTCSLDQVVDQPAHPQCRRTCNRCRCGRVVVIHTRIYSRAPS